MVLYATYESVDTGLFYGLEVWNVTSFYDCWRLSPERGKLNLIVRGLKDSKLESLVTRRAELYTVKLDMSRILNGQGKNRGFLGILNSIYNPNGCLQRPHAEIKESSAIITAHFSGSPSDELPLDLQVKRKCAFDRLGLMPVQKH